MPKVLSYTPEWLARPSPGYDIFAPKQTSGNGVSVGKNDFGPRRTIATRGSEVFVAVGHEIRWADLANLKEGVQSAYRTLRISVPLPITRLAISPNQDYLAVSTTHTVHVVHLPDAALLEDTDQGPIKPKTFQIGPTAHVTEESPVATTLWHPLGYHGRALVTITKAGVVRLWEINRADRSSFSEPALSIDLAKLANATNDQVDLSASKFGVSKGFSPDSVDLEVASACFGDFPDQEGVHGWAPMTLWIATIPGDVYALCPLLPEKWQLVESPGTVTFLQTLISSINIHHSDVNDDANASKDEVRTSEKQIKWLSDIIYQQPYVEETPSGDSIKVFTRPSAESAHPVPMLQGPFTITPEVDDFELSDMIVYSLKTMSEGEDEETAEGLPAAVVCLLTDTCKVHVCLDLEGIVGRWLPTQEHDAGSVESDEHDLIIAETIQLIEGEQSSYNQSITADVHTDFSFFVSHATGVFYISMEPWIRKLEDELSQPQTEGADFRIRSLLESADSVVEKHLTCRVTGDPAQQAVTSSVVIEDGNIGYLLLTSVQNEPQAAFLDAPEYGLPTEDDMAAFMDVGAPQSDVREAWQPPRELYEPIDLLGSITIPARHKAALKEEIRLSPANLELLMDVHRVLSAKTVRLQYAVSELFNRATRLQEEFRDQIWRTTEISSKVDAVTGGDDTASDGGFTRSTVKINERMDNVRAKQDEINQRYEKLRNKMAKIGSSQLSDKEAAFKEELIAMDGSVNESSSSLTEDVDGSHDPAWQRLEKLQQLKKELSKQVDAATKETSSQGTKPRSGSMNVPSHSRKQEDEQIQQSLDRISVLVEAATQRLQSLGVDVAPKGSM